MKIITTNKNAIFYFLGSIGTFTIILTLCIITMAGRSATSSRNMLLGGILTDSSHNDSNEYVFQNNSSKEAVINKKYFRPSCLPALNTKNYVQLLRNCYEKKPSEIAVPPSLILSPEETIVSYFSILREAENLGQSKSGGCGTVGWAKLPFPLAYNFLTPGYQKQMSYDNFLNSFENIGHTNLIKLMKVPGDKNNPGALKFFIEVETLEGSDKCVTYFAYYYGYIYIQKVNEGYKISNLQFYGEDFLCAAYHGWSHLAEAYVDVVYGNWCALVKERRPTVQEGYVKDIYVKGTDNNEYLFKFFQLTNGTDVEIEQYIKSNDGKWTPVDIDVKGCLEKKRSRQ